MPPDLKAVEPTEESEQPAQQQFVFTWVAVGAADGMPRFDGQPPTPLQLLALGSWLQHQAEHALSAREEAAAMAQLQAQQQAQDIARRIGLRR